MSRLKPFRPLDTRGVEILDELERRNDVQPDRVDDDGTRWYDPSKFGIKQVVPDDEFKTLGKGTFQIPQ